MDIKKSTKQIIKKYHSHLRTLVGLAHSDKGKKVKGCDCCYCKPKED